MDRKKAGNVVEIFVYFIYKSLIYENQIFAAEKRQLLLL